MRGLNPEEIAQVAGGPGPLVIIVIPVVKASSAVKGAAAAGSAAGVAGATVALSNDKKEE